MVNPPPASGLPGGPPPPPAAAAFDQIVVNAADPAALARFWGRLLGVEPAVRADGWAVLAGEGARPRLSFQPDPAPVPVDRIHLDLRVGDIAAASAAAVAHGATAVGAPVTDEQGSFQVLRDPEGNVFCLTAPAQR
ncbi:VOC family protein [Nocardiopsis coralliicola]